ncbi:hypothetical protein FOMPIDRAFT_1063079, partial [Fomitopsis schrenkii]
MLSTAEHLGESPGACASAGTPVLIPPATWCCCSWAHTHTCMPAWPFEQLEQLSILECLRRHAQASLSIFHESRHRHLSNRTPNKVAISAKTQTSACHTTRRHCPDLSPDHTTVARGDATPAAECGLVWLFVRDIRVADQRASCAVRPSPFVSVMAGAASFAYANAPLPPAARTQLVCTERSELPNDSYMLKLQMQVCEPEAPKRPNTEHIAAEARKLHAQAQQLGSTWRPLAPAPAPIMQLQPWQRPPSPQIPPHVHRWTETSHPQTAQVMHPSHQRHYPNVQTRAVSHGWHTHSPSPSPSTHSPSPSSSSRSSSSSPSSTRAPSPAPAPSKPAPPLLLPAPREDCIKRTVPQQVWDPYAPDRSAENAKDVVIHYFPSGVTPLDTARVPFDLRGMPPGTGIPLSVLDAAHIDNTMRYVVDACEPIEIRRQIWERGSCFVASDEMYSYLVLCMK